MTKWPALLLCAGLTPAHASDFVFFHGFETSLHPVAGAVIITEIMSNPTAVLDTAGEWFELANVSTQTIDLGGCAVSQNMSQAILPAYALAADAFAVVARSSDYNQNGMVSAFATFSFGLAASGSLSLDCDGRGVDAVTWPGESPGHSSNLYPANFNAVDNDDWINNWCFTTTLYNEVDTGSPAAANESCPHG
jgi:hypothetical protein